MSEMNWMFLGVGIMAGFFLGGCFIRCMGKFEEWVDGGAEARKAEVKEAQRNEDIWHNLYSTLILALKSEAEISGPSGEQVG